MRYLATRQEEVFYSRQVEVAHEDDHFHWITNRVIHELVEDGVLLEETRPLATGGGIHLLWPRSYKHYRRRAKAVVGLVEEYASPNIGAAVGLQGEALVLEGFARHQFVLRGRNTNEYRGQKWSASEHDLDFIFERDGRGYGVEVKNTLGYMDQDEFRTKIAVCRKLGLFPVLAARMLPRTWIHELEAMASGFALILKWQLYPWGFRDLARRVRQELQLPVDTPAALWDGTMSRFTRWHERFLK